MTKVENGKVAFVKYTGTFPETGEVFDSNINAEPLPFLVGYKNMIEGFEQELMGTNAVSYTHLTLPTTPYV